MKHFLSLERLDVGRTLALTVGSPSVHRRGTMLKLLSVLVLILTIGVGNVWGAGTTVTYAQTSTSAASVSSGTAPTGSSVSFNNSYSTKEQLTNNNSMVLTLTGYTGYKITAITLSMKSNKSSGSGTFSAVAGSTTLASISSNTGFDSWYDNSSWSQSYIDVHVTMTNSTYEIKQSENVVITLTCPSGKSNNSLYCQSFTITYEAVSSGCDNSVTIATGTPTNATISVSSTSVATCSSTASDRYVTVSVAPSSCYAAPVKASVTQSGTTASWVSGPTWNNTTSKYDYVYSFAQDATGTTTFNVSLTTKTTYTVNFNKGNATGATGEASSDTKTCGEALTLPNSALFTRTGYTQQGWSTAQAGTTKTYNLGGSYTTDAATTLYPYWQANSYSVTWKVNNTNYSAGGSTSVNHDSHIASLPTAPNPASYCGDKFVGWTTDAEYVHGSSPLYTTASQFPNATTDQIFYAVFADYDE